MSHNRSPSNVSTGVTYEIKFNSTSPQEESLPDGKNHKSDFPGKRFSVTYITLISRRYIDPYLFMEFDAMKLKNTDILAYSDTV